MLDHQLTLDVSPYSTLYDIVVPKTHFLRQIHDVQVSPLKRYLSAIRCGCDGIFLWHPQVRDVLWL